MSNDYNDYGYMPYTGTGQDNVSFDIELLKREVGQRFPFYDLRFDQSTAVFYVRVDTDTVDEQFDSLHVSLSERGYLPLLRCEHGEHLLYVVQKPRVKKKPVWVNLLLLAATILTTTLAGAYQWVEINQGEWVEMFSEFYLWQGFVFFSVPLLSILGVHEMGHYFVSKRHGLDASLPYFIPLPPPFVLGTFGALISTHEPIPNRKTLFDVGVSGPICGFVVAVIVSFVGFGLMEQNPLPVSPGVTGVTISLPLILEGMSRLFNLPTGMVIQIHPTLFAGWVGIFLTAVNLLPIGQLDGGHVAQAVLKDYHKYLSWVIVIVLVILGLFYQGWFMFAFLVLFFIGMRHQPPLNELSTLDSRRKFVGVLIVVIFIVSFAPIPLA
ncbi:MAG: site-2 protease family protein [Candidatus Thermoplasmatota archaeon]